MPLAWLELQCTVKWVVSNLFVHSNASLHMPPGKKNASDLGHYFECLFTYYIYLLYSFCISKLCFIYFELMEMVLMRPSQYFL